MLGAVWRESVVSEHLTALLEYWNAPVVPTVPCICQGGSIAQARNRVATNCLNSDCTDLVFLDSDLIPRREHFQRILQHDYDVVSGCYLKRKDGPPEWAVNVLEEGEIESGAIVRCKWLPAGFLRIKRRVLERMAEIYPEQRYSTGEDGSESVWNFFRVGLVEEEGRRIYHEEDVGFSHWARQAGFELMLDTGILLRHVGKVVFPLAHQWEMMKAAGAESALPL
jgi:hypothetical protein